MGILAGLIGGIEGLMAAAPLAAEAAAPLAEGALAGAAPLAEGALAGAAPIAESALAGAPTASLAGATPDLTSVLASGDINIPPNATFTSGAVPGNLSDMSFGAFETTDAAGNVVNSGDLNMPALTNPGDTSALALNPSDMRPIAGTDLPTEITTGSSDAYNTLANNINAKEEGFVAGLPTTPDESGIMSSLNSVAGSPLTKLGLAAAPLAYILAKGQPQVPPQAQAVQGPSQQEIAFGQQELAAVAANQVTPAQAAQLDIQRKNWINELRQQYANMGRNPDQDTAYLQGVQQIDERILAMQQQMITTTLQAGLQSLGQGSQNVLAVANMQMQADTNYQNAITNAMKAMGSVMGGTNVIKLG